MKKKNVYDSPILEEFEIETSGQIAVSLTAIVIDDVYEEGEEYTW